jgi:hypothetical protein
VKASSGIDGRPIVASNRIVVANSFELNERNPWDKLPQESSKAFEAFLTFRDLGYDRSVKEVSRQLNKAYQLLYRWHRDFGWTERAQAWDEFQDQLGQRETIRQRAEFRKASLLVAQNMTSKALAGFLALKFTSKVKRKRRGKGGKCLEEEVLVTTVSDLVKMFACAHKVQKDVLGMAGEDKVDTLQVQFLPTPDDDEPEQSPARPEDGQEAT